MAELERDAKAATSRSDETDEQLQHLQQVLASLKVRVLSAPPLFALATLHVVLRAVHCAQ